MVVVTCLLGALAFGAGDQYIGSFSAHPWTAELSLLSAPWLVLPFVAGWTQPDPRRAARLGLACTVTALAGYMLMTLSPFEHASLTPQSLLGFVRSQRLVAGAIVSGPLFGWWGSRWRTERAWVGALVTAAAVCLEPLAHRVAPSRVGGIFLGQPLAFRSVWIAETGVGLAMLAYVALAARRRHMRRI